jgi:hypothetical protein
LNSELEQPTPVVWDGDYDKQFYWVHLPDGSRVECWPNAGIMNATDGSGRQWRPEDKPLITVQADHESRFKAPAALRESHKRVREERKVLAVGVDYGAAERTAISAIHAMGRGMTVERVLVVNQSDPRLEGIHTMGRPLITHPLLSTADKLRLEAAHAKRERRKAKRRPR